jgi:hypothetical protein
VNPKVLASMREGLVALAPSVLAQKIGRMPRAKRRVVWLTPTWYDTSKLPIRCGRSLASPAGREVVVSLCVLADVILTLTTMVIGDDEDDEEGMIVTLTP